MSQYTLMVMAGGTGGHVYPAMAVADVLLEKGWRVVWLCTQGGMENRLIADKPYEKTMIQMHGVRGKGIRTWLTMPMAVFRALMQSMLALRKYQPNVVLGMGGFAAFPGGIAAKLLGKPLVIHEQNSVAGLTNRVLAKLANRTLCAFPNALADSEMVGNPVRADICHLPAPLVRMAKRAGKLRILVVGGSLGAQALNQTVPAALAMLEPNQRPEVVHQAGTQHIQDLQHHYRRYDIEADCREYLQDMAHWYAWADFVICRAGAMTIAELSSVGLGSLLVPFPYAVDDHQTSNAHYLVEAGAALLIQQKDFNAEGLADVLVSLNHDQCLLMAEKAHQLGKPKAAHLVAHCCEELVA